MGTIEEATAPDVVCRETVARNRAQAVTSGEIGQRYTGIKVDGRRLSGSGALAAA
jgi:hypothetical protein